MPLNVPTLVLVLLAWTFLGWRRGHWLKGASVGLLGGFATLLLRTIILVGRGFDESFYLFILDPQGPDPLLRALGYGYNLLKDVVVLGVIAGVVALSDSSVQIASSTAMVSPTFTNSSMIGTESKSPMSGTFTSII